MKTNNDIDDLIIRFLENNISKEEKKHCLNWVQYSKENYTHFKKTIRAWEASRMFKPKNNASKLGEIYNSSKINVSSIYYQITGLVAIVIVIILSTVYISQNNKTEYITVSSQNNKERIMLPDSSIVWLNENSSIKYPSNFNKKERVVSLIGEAFFNVAQNREAPFIVSTSKIEVEVLGTRFLIKESDFSDEIFTILESGKISLSIDSSPNNIILEPNDMLVYNKNTREIIREKVVAKDYSKWINNRMIFENTPIEEIFSYMEDRDNVKIEIKNEDIKKIPVSIIIDEETLEETMNTLQLIVSFEYVQNNNKITINK